MAELKILVTADTKQAQTAIENIAKTANKISGTRGTGNTQKNSISAYTEQQKKYIQAEKEVSAARQKAIRDIDNIGKSVQNNNGIYQKHNSQVLGLAKSFMQWQVAATLVMQPIYKTKQALESLNQTLVKTESTVIALKRVLNEDIADKKISDELYNIAISYGQSFDNVSEIATNFARSGKSWADTVELTKGAVLALNVAELDASEASDGLIAIMAQFKLQASETVDVIDKLNKTADNFPVTTEKLLKALQRTGSAAVNANLDIDKTIGLVTALSQATGRSGENIGTALNSLLQYSGKSSALEIFASLSDETAKVVEKYKMGAADMLDIWKAVSVVIKNADDRQKQILNTFTESDEIKNLGQDLHDELGDIFEQTQEVYGTANTFRKNYFIALLDNIETVTKASEVAANAMGYSAKENEQEMNTYAKRVQALQSQWEKLANDEQGVLALKKAMVGLGAEILTVINNAGGLKSALLPLTSIFAPQILKGVTALGKGISNIAHVTQLAANASELAAAADSARTVAVNSLSAADTAHRIGIASTSRQLELYQIASHQATIADEAEAKAAAAAAAAAQAKALAIQAAAAVIGIAIMVGMKLYSDYRENLRKTAEQAEETAKKSVEAADKLTEIKKSMDEGTKSSDELRTAFVEQQKAMGKTDTEISTLIGKYKDLGKAIDETTEKQIRQAQFDAEKSMMAAGRNAFSEANGGLFSGIVSGRAKLGSFIADEKLYGKDLAAALTAQSLNVNVLNFEPKNIKELQEYYEQLLSLQEKVNERAKETGNLDIFNDKAAVELEEEINRLSEVMDDYIDKTKAVEEQSKALAKIKFTNLFGDFENFDSTKIEEYKNQIKELGINIPEVERAMYNLLQQIYEADNLVQTYGKNMNLTNSEALQLRNGLIALENAGYSLSTATYATIQALATEGKISVDTANKILQLQKETWLLTSASNSADLSNVINQIAQSGLVAEETVGKLRSLAAAFNALGKGLMANKNFFKTGSHFPGTDIRDSLFVGPEPNGDYYIGQMNDIIGDISYKEIEIPNTPSGGGRTNYSSASPGGGKGKSGGGGGGKETDPVQEKIDAYKKIIELLKAQYDLLDEQDAPLETKILKLKEIQEQLHAENEYLREQDKYIEKDENGNDVIKYSDAHAKERLANSKEWLEIEKQAHSLTEQVYKDEINLYESKLSILEKQEDKDDERIANLKYQNEVLHVQADFLREIGAKEADINKLSAEYLSNLKEIEKIDKERAENYWNEFEKAVEKELEKAREIRDDLIAEKEAEKEALNAKKDAQKETNDLLEKEKALREALIALEEARNQRNIRVYNEKSGQWEWQANAKDVENAEKAYENARKSLAEYKEEVKYQEAVDQIDLDIKRINKAYDKIERGWKAITDSLEEPVRDINLILDDIALHGLPKMKAVINNVNDILGSLKDFTSPYEGKIIKGYEEPVKTKNGVLIKASDTEGVIAQMKANSAQWANATASRKQALNMANKVLANSIGASYNSSEGAYYKDGKRLYDTGGILNGLGGIKGTSQPEAILSPELTRKILNPVSNSRFTEFAKSLGIIFNEQRFTRQPTITKTAIGTQNYNQSYSVNGIPITQQMAQHSVAEVFDILNLQ